MGEIRVQKVLIVEDEQSIVKLLEYNLKQEGYGVEAAYDGQSGYEKAIENDYDMILLDLMLPKKDGIAVCRELRQEKVDIPIIMLTAKDSEVDKIIGLEIGADDYITKPFSPREVIARMKAIWRRYHQIVSTRESQNDKNQSDQTEDPLFIGDLTIYPNEFEVVVRGEKVELTPKEFDLLLYMAHRKDRILSREQLLDAIWDYDFSGETRIVDVHISHLREKIEKDTKSPQYILTARGFGYKFQDPTL